MSGEAGVELGFCRLQVSTVASILLSLIPFVLLFIFNLLIYCLVKRSPLPRSSSRQRREQGVARILIIIIVVYIACHGIITYINIIELVGIIRGTHNTSLLAPGAVTHHLQNPKWSAGGPKWRMGSRKGLILRFFTASINIAK